MNIKPMLAHKFDEARIDFKKDVVYMQPKLNADRDWETLVLYS